MYLAILFHDAGYFEDHERLGFETKEKYSANLAESVLSRDDYPQLEIEAVKNAIISTEKNATFETAEQQAVRAADLFGMAASYDVFLLNNIKLKKEHEYLSKSIISWGAWRKVSIDVVKDFVAQDIPLIPHSLFLAKPCKYQLFRFVKQELHRKDQNLMLKLFHVAVV